jgi:hypothetical protein
MLKSTLLIITIFIIVIILAFTVLSNNFNEVKKQENFGSSDWVAEWRALSQPYVIYYDSDLYPQYDQNYLNLNYKGSNEHKYQ